MPDGVIVNPLELLSIKRLDWQVRSCVPDTAVNGVVLGVNADVYTAVPLTILKLEM